MIVLEPQRRVHPQPQPYEHEAPPASPTGPVHRKDAGCMPAPPPASPPAFPGLSPIRKGRSGAPPKSGRS
jgi:hypothetical protein